MRFLRLAAAGSGGKLVHSGASFVAIGNVIKVYTAGGQMIRVEARSKFNGGPFLAGGTAVSVVFFCFNQ